MKQIYIPCEIPDIIPVEKADISKGIIVKDMQDMLVGFVTFSNKESSNIHIKKCNGEHELAFMSLEELMKRYSLTCKFYQL